MMYCRLPLLREALTWMLAINRVSLPPPLSYSFDLDAGNRGEWFQDPVLGVTLQFVEKVWI